MTTLFFLTLWSALVPLLQNLTACFSVSLLPILSFSHPSSFSYSPPPPTPHTPTSSVFSPLCCSSNLIVSLLFCTPVSISFFPYSLHLCCSLFFFFFLPSHFGSPALCLLLRLPDSEGGGAEKRVRKLARRERETLRGMRDTLCEWKRGRERWEIWNWCHSVGSFFLFRLNNHDS